MTLYNTHTRPPGNCGHQGFYGAPPATPLCSGAAGAPGAVQIKVKSSNGMESVYPGKYHLTVTSFEVVDENGDMIMEPGEHIIVRNICVQNTGIYLFVSYLPGACPFPNTVNRFHAEPSPPENPNPDQRRRLAGAADRRARIPPDVHLPRGDRQCSRRGACFHTAGRSTPLSGYRLFGDRGTTTDRDHARYKPNTPRILPLNRGQHPVPSGARGAMYLAFCRAREQCYVFLAGTRSPHRSGYPGHG